MGAKSFFFSLYYKICDSLLCTEHEKKNKTTAALTWRQHENTSRRSLKCKAAGGTVSGTWEAPQNEEKTGKNVVLEIQR